MLYMLFINLSFLVFSVAGGGLLGARHEAEVVLVPAC